MMDGPGISWTAWSLLKWTFIVGMAIIIGATITNILAGGAS